MIPSSGHTRVDEVLTALANPTRRRVLELLLEHGRLPVRALAARFEMTRPSVSEHLRVLRKAGLVTHRKQGRERLYHLEPKPLMDLRDWLKPYEEFWRGRLENLRELLDEETDG